MKIEIKTESNILRGAGQVKMLPIHIYSHCNMNDFTFWTLCCYNYAYSDLWPIITAQASYCAAPAPR